MAWMLLLALFPGDSQIVVDRVDIIEVNYFINDLGAVNFGQVIFWEWDRYNKRFRVVDFRILERDVQHVWPAKTDSGLYVYIWWDERNHVARKVFAPYFYITVTCEDPEMQDREKWPKDERRELRPPPKRK